MSAKLPQWVEEKRQKMNVGAAGRKKRVQIQPKYRPAEPGYPPYDSGPNMKIHEKFSDEGDEWFNQLKGYKSQPQVQAETVYAPPITNPASTIISPREKPETDPELGSLLQNLSKEELITILKRQYKPHEDDVSPKIQSMGPSLESTTIDKGTNKSRNNEFSKKSSSKKPISSQQGLQT